MPQRKSAKEELNKNQKRHTLNLARKRAIKDAVKAFKKSLESKNTQEVQKSLNNVYKMLDKAASKNLLHPNKAARKKSRFSSLSAQVLKPQASA